MATRSQKSKNPSVITHIQRTGLKSMVNDKDNAIVNGKNACLNSNKKIKIDRENGVGTVYDSEEGKRTVHCWQFNKTVNGLRLQNGVTAKGPKKTRFTDPKLGDNIAYFAIVRKSLTPKRKPTNSGTLNQKGMTTLLVLENHIGYMIIPLHQHH